MWESTIRSRGNSGKTDENASICSDEIDATTSTPCSGPADQSKIFSCCMNGRNRHGNSAGLSPRCSWTYILSSVPWAKSSSGMRGRPASVRARITSRMTTAFMNAWWAIARPNSSPVLASISSIHSVTKAVRRARYASTSSGSIACHR